MVNLVGDSQLDQHNIKIETERKVNKDSTPVAEKTVTEFRDQKLKFTPQGGPVSETERATITASLNRMIRNRNLSSREIITKTNQETHESLDLVDKDLACDQVLLRKKNHPLSEKCKLKNGKPATKTTVCLLKKRQI